MAATYLSLDKIKPNKANPRDITPENYEKLLNSIRESYEMLETNPLKLDESNMLLGGNMRLRALKELGFDEVPVEYFTKEQAKRINVRRKALGKPRATYKALCAEIIIKDNVSYGHWDNVRLNADFAEFKLEDWGLIGFQQPEISLDDFFAKREDKAGDEVETPTQHSITITLTEAEHAKLMEIKDHVESEEENWHDYLISKLFS